MAGKSFSGAKSGHKPEDSKKGKELQMFGPKSAVKINHSPRHWAGDVKEKPKKVRNRSVMGGFLLRILVQRQDPEVQTACMEA